MNPLLAALLAQPWAMDPVSFRAMVAAIEAALAGKQTGDFKAFFDMGSLSADRGLDVVDGVATIPIHGVMMKSVPGILKMLGFGGADIEDARERLLEAVFRDDVKAIVLDIDSPGGDVAGTKDLADEVYAARSLKPITARASGAMASAAYWVGSQANRVTATASTTVGSIGVVATITDASKQAEGEGLKVHVIGSNALKGMGTPGSEVTDEQLTDLRALVTKFADMFSADIGRGRGMKAAEVSAVATGAVWVGKEAKAIGLVDEIEKSKVNQKEKAMDIEKLKAELAAKIAECGTLSASVKDLTTQLEAATKKLTELDAAVKEAQASQREMLMAKYADRVAPANLEAIKKYGDYCAADLARFEAHLKSLPSVTRAERVSNPGDQPSSDPQAELPPAVLQVAKMMGNSVQDIRKISAPAA